MKVIISEPCGGLCPETRRPFAFDASEFPVEVGDKLGRSLIKAKMATRHAEPKPKTTTKKAAAK